MSWEMISLSQCTEYITDGDHQPAPKSEKGIRLIKIKDIKNNKISFDNALYVPVDYYKHLAEDHKAKKYDILYTVVGSFGIPAFVDFDIPFCFERNIALLHPNKSIIPKFLYYVLKTDMFFRQAAGVANGAAQKLIPLKKLKNLTFLKPPLIIQQKIVNILSAYDNLIENNNKQIKLFEEAAQRLYKEWFVDLRFPGYENVAFVDGVPEGWNTLQISDVCDTIGGGTPSTKVKEYYQDGDILWVTPTDITKNNSIIVLGTDTKITREGLKNSSAKMVPAETILMTSRASVGFFGICEYEVCTNQGFISCIPYMENMQMYILYNSNFAHRFWLCTLKIQYLAVVKLSKCYVHAACSHNLSTAGIASINASTSSLIFSSDNSELSISMLRNIWSNI